MICFTKEETEAPSGAHPVEQGQERLQSTVWLSRVRLAVDPDLLKPLCPHLQNGNGRGPVSYGDLEPSMRSSTKSTPGSKWGGV